jgi:hypothetical protein
MDLFIDHEIVTAKTVPKPIPDLIIIDVSKFLKFKKVENYFLHFIITKLNI